MNKCSQIKITGVPLISAKLGFSGSLLTLSSFIVTLATDITLPFYHVYLAFSACASPNVTDSITGGLSVLFAGLGVLCPLICTKGLIWLRFLVATIAEVLFVVSGYFLVPVRSIQVHCELMSHVFLSLNLKGIFPILSFCQRRTQMTGLDSARNLGLFKFN